MRQIDSAEYKKILLDILEYFDDVCRKNGIKYSLIGGSLIGAIRHNGIIPWDDDIDIILMKKDYDKLLKILKKDTSSNYTLIDNSTNSSYHYPFAKLVNSNTKLIENGVKDISNYGVYIDIFQYNYISNNKLLRAFHYYFQRIIKGLLGASVSNYDTFFKKCISFIGKLFGYKFWLKLYFAICSSRKKSSNYIVSNWPAYGYKREIQKIQNFTKFTDWNFDGLKVMITENYDELLKTVFGDYMKLPPENERKHHDNVAYWK